MTTTPDTPPSMFNHSTELPFLKKKHPILGANSETDYQKPFKTNWNYSEQLFQDILYKCSF